MYTTNFVILSRANFEWEFEVLSSNNLIVMDITMCVPTSKLGLKKPHKQKIISRLFEKNAISQMLFLFDFAGVNI